MSLENRLNIAPLAKRFQKNGVGNDDLDAVNDFFYASQYEYSKVWPQIKPEVYGLTAVLVDGMMTRAVSLKSARAPFGLITKNSLSDYKVVDFPDLDSKAPFISISGFVKETLLAAILEEFEEIKSGKDQMMLSIYQRLELLMANLSEAQPASTRLRYRSKTEGFLTLGMNFAALRLASLADVIPRVEEGLSAKKSVEVARDSYPFVIKIATADLEKAINLVNALSLAENRSQFDPKYFALIKHQNRLMLDLSIVGKKRLGEIGLSLSNLTSNQVPTIGCPGVVNFGGESAVKRLWSWYGDIAEKIYPLM